GIEVAQALPEFAQLHPLPGSRRGPCADHRRPLGGGRGTGGRGLRLAAGGRGRRRHGGCARAGIARRAGRRLRRIQRTQCRASRRRGRRGGGRGAAHGAAEVELPGDRPARLGQPAPGLPRPAHRPRRPAALPGLLPRACRLPRTVRGAGVRRRAGPLPARTPVGGSALHPPRRARHQSLAGHAGHAAAGGRARPAAVTGAAPGPSSPRGPYRAAGVPGRWRAVACGGSLLAGLVLAGCGGGEAPATTPPPAAPAPAASATAASPAAAVTVTSVDIGPELAPGGRTTRPAIRFAPGDTIHAVASIAAPDTGAPHTGRLVARWTYGDGQPVAETGHDF